jgi:hypothetical protein
MKSIFTSKTFWFNLLAGVAAVAQVIPVTPYTAAAGAIANILLRAITTQPVSVPGAPAALTPTPTKKIS